MGDGVNVGVKVGDGVIVSVNEGVIVGVNVGGGVPGRII